MAKANDGKPGQKISRQISVEEIGTLSYELPMEEASRLEQMIAPSQQRPLLYANLAKWVKLDNIDQEFTYTELLRLLQDYQAQIVGEGLHKIVDAAVEQYYEV